MIEKNLTCNLVDKINGYEILRCEVRTFCEYANRFYGTKKVYYDVCLPDGGDIIESRRTLKEAIKFAKEL